MKVKFFLGSLILFFSSSLLFAQTCGEVIHLDAIIEDNTSCSLPNGSIYIPSLLITGDVFIAEGDAEFNKYEFTIYEGDVFGGTIVSETNSATDLYEGMYTVSVRNSENPNAACTDEFAYFINSSPLPFPEFNVEILDNTICDEMLASTPFDGQITLLPISNTVADFTYQWYEGSSLSNPIIGQESNVLSGVEGGDYTVLVTFNENGCSEIFLYSLPNDFTTNTIETSMSICGGESFNFGGNNLTESGEYTHMFANQFGCDSTVILNLVVNPAYERSENVSICEGESYEFFGQVLTVAGEYQGTFETQMGCDSIVNLTLAVHPTHSVAETISICNGDVFAFGGSLLSIPGEYEHTFLNQFGCDSLVTLTLQEMISYELEVTEDAISVISSDDLTFLWYDCVQEALIDGATSSSFIPSESGEFQVEISNENCSIISNCVAFEIEMPLNVEEKEEKFPFIILKRPGKQLTILFQQTPFAGQYILNDMNGKLIYSGQLDNQTSVSFDLSTVSNSLFVLRLKENHGRFFSYRLFAD